jgi:uncharacterized protein (TIRG00374 family)
MNWKTLIGLLISAVFLFLALRKVDPGELKSALESADYIYLLPVVLLVMVSMILRVFRWRYLLRPVKEISFGSIFYATAIGLMANNVLPARLGEFIRAYVIGRRENISKSASFATVIVARIFDGLTILSFLAAVFVFYAFSLPGWLRKAAIITLVLYLLAIVVLVLLKIRTEAVLRAASFILKPLPDRMGERVLQILDSFAGGLKILHSTREILYSAVLSIFIWVPNIVIIYLLLLSFGIHLPFFASMVLLVAIVIGVTIPSAPGYIGTIQYATVAGLALFGVPKSLALSFSLVYHAAVFIPATIAGIICLPAAGFSFRELRTSVESPDADFDKNG